MLILAKNKEIMLLPFSLNLTKTPELLNAANKLRANAQVKADATSRVTSCGNKAPWMKQLISRPKEIMLLLKFACNTDLGPKKMVAWSVNNNVVLQNWWKVQLILAVYFSENRWKLCSWWRIMKLCYHNPDLLKLCWAKRIRERHVPSLPKPFFSLLHDS